MSPLLTILIILLATTPITLGGTVCAALLTRTDIEEVRLFFGRAILKTTIKGTQLSLGWLPTGGYVRIKGMEAGSPVEEGSFQALSNVSKLIVIFGGSLTLLLFGCVFAGVGRALHGFVTGLYQVPMDALHPLSLGKQCVEWTLETKHAQGWATAIGIVGVKMAALDVMPFLKSSIQAVASLTGQQVRARYMIFALVLQMLLTAGWGIAVIAFLLSP